MLRQIMKSQHRIMTTTKMYWKRLTYKKKMYAISSIVFLLFFSIYYTLSVGDEIIIPADVNIDRYAPFEPDVTVEFPQGKPGDVKIPRIIHQTFWQTSIPPSFHDNIGSLMKHNPTWTYYLWTDEASRRLIADTHPELLATFDGYSEFIRRADFIRYVVLYEFGGLYADMDTTGFRPLDVAITKYSCVFPSEPFEHSALRAGAPYLINNAIMMCKPKHPFLKFVLQSLPRFAHMAKVVDSTGPFFITTMYMQYNNITRESNKRDPGITNSPYFYKGALPENDDRAVYVPNSQYFCNKLDPMGIWFIFYRVCKDFTGLNLLEQRACVNMKRRGMWRKPGKFAIIEHDFYRTYGFWHFYNYVGVYLYLFSKDIHELVPHAKIYEGRNDLKMTNTKLS